jgi:cell division protein FtsW
MPRLLIYDRWLFITTGLLVVGGLFMVGSASNFFAMDSGLDPSAFWWKQGLHVLLGFGALILGLSIPYRELGRGSVVALSVLSCFALLVLVLAMPEVAGTHRWIPLGPFKLQPSELAKLVVVVFMAYMLSRKEKQVNEFGSVLMPCLMTVGACGFLVVIEPDLGSGVILVVVACVMLFAAGLRWSFIAGLGLLGALGFAAGVLAQPYRLERIKSFLNPTDEPLGSAFQLNQSLIAIGSGGLTGTGLGHSTQKAYYLPAAHTDFIFSVVGEELGLVGCGLVLLGFLVLFWRGVRTAVRAPDRLGFYLALGLTHLLVLQALINMGVCVGLLPTKGMPLPFISYGGSSLLASMAAMGLLLNVSKYSN